MKLPELKQTEKYVGLYIFDFGDHAGVGFTAGEVAELLESQKYQHGKVYKIHRAYPDGKMEIKGVPAETFQLEAGLFFHTADLVTARQNYDKLVKSGVTNPPPCRAKVHLSETDTDFVTALIYPAEYDSEISHWLMDIKYKAAGFAEGSTAAVERYYGRTSKIVDKHQFYGNYSHESRTGQELLANLKKAVQR